jgi:hypothetical protein
MGTHHSTTTLNYVVTHSLRTEFEEENFIKECHAVPSKMHRITEEL